MTSEWNLIQLTGYLNTWSAVKSYQKALAINPDYAEAWHNLRFVTRALQFLKGGGDQAGNIGTSELNDAAYANVGFALHQFYLAGFRPHQAEESYERIIAALPPLATQTLPIRGAGRGRTAKSRLPDQVVALLHYGRSGTGLLHSLMEQ